MKIMVILIAVVLLHGCASQTVHINRGGAYHYDAQHKSADVFFLGGLLQENTTNAAAICGGFANIAKITTKQSFANTVVGLVTIGLITPRTIYVYCWNDAYQNTTKERGSAIGKLKKKQRPKTKQNEPSRHSRGSSIGKLP